MKKIIILLIPFFLSACIKEPDCEIVNPEGVNYKGCGNFMVFDKFGEVMLNNAIIHVEMDKSMYNLNEAYQSFDLSQHPDIICQITTHNKATESGNMCTDALDPELVVQNVWTATEGSVQVRITRDKTECDDTYVVSVILEDVTFVDNNGNDIGLPYKSFFNRMVNYLIG